MKNKGLNVLSLFSGMECGRIALTELKISINKYYASEIDKHAIKQTQLNFPDIIQLGDITKWKEWDIEWSCIDLILAGSPCQGFSFSGKQLAFSDPRSKLFFVFIDILNHVKRLNPDVMFLLENVNMKKDYMNVISEYCGVLPVNINSNLVSAQNRNRWYWTNIRTKEVGLFGDIIVDIPQPKDKGILLRDILERKVDEKYYIKNEKILKFITDEWRLKKKYTQIDGEGKSLPIMARVYASWCGDYIYQRARGNNQGGLFEGKVPTISACSWEQNNLLLSDRIRRLTPTECARLQTVPSWYRWECSDTQAYRMLGNGWTIDVISHILLFIKKNI